MDLAAYIDHTVLKPDATSEDVRILCSEAKEHQFAAVCVNPCFVDLAAHLLKGSNVKVATVIGFPLGANLSSVKAFETEQAVLQKADEIDMVINLGAAKLGLWEAVQADIEAVVTAADGRTVKVIVETGLLNKSEKRRVCETVLASGAHFIKTSTGFGPGGATVEDVALFKSIVGDRIGIKASGGVRSKEDAERMIAAGATRIGTSGGVKIVSG
ncbi:deoxyribose-phosphate aldolase [Azotosporobacter soli]|uniref:deoxyribose-phosphate aldolase n=1 Tax=Azotosporobacter soli TaxID=3055040 RepID=UPI0031FE7CEE